MDALNRRIDTFADDAGVPIEARSMSAYLDGLGVAATDPEAAAAIAALHAQPERTAIREAMRAWRSFRMSTTPSDPKGSSGLSPDEPIETYSQDDWDLAAAVLTVFMGFPEETGEALRLRLEAERQARPD